MKLAVVYNPNDTKLTSSAYSWTYRDMFLAILEKFAPVIHITGPCEARSIEADYILFYDVHSSHHIEIKGIEKHPAVKIEYFNDPHQAEQVGVYKSTGQKFHKLSAEQRTERAKKRGVKYVICPYREGYEKYITPYAGDMELIWFPPAPANRRVNPSRLSARAPEVLLSGHLWEGIDGFRPYEFRRWSAAKSFVTKAEHPISGGTPSGNYYQAYLSRYAGALALCDCYVVPKYIEIPLAGCVCFCQMQDEYKQMGFEDGVSCVALDKNNFDERIRDFIKSPAQYQTIADAGRRLAATKYTAKCFAEFLSGFLK